MSMAATPSAWLCRKLRQVRRWGVRPAQHVLGDGGRTDLNPEFEQTRRESAAQPRAGWQRTSGGSICGFPCSRVVALRATASSSRAESLGGAIGPRLPASPVPWSGGNAPPHPVEPDPQHPIDGVPAQTAAPLTIQHRYLMTQRDELKRQFCAAAKPASQPRQGRRNQWEHAGDITESRPKSPAFSLLSEFQQEQPAKRAGTICRRSHPRPLTRRNSHEPELRYLTWMNGSFPGLRVISSTRL